MSDPSITDWISALSAGAGTAIAGVTAWLAYRQYLRAPVQEDDPEDASDAKAEPSVTEVIVFKTSKQTTRLKADKGEIQCHLDDTREGRGGPQWTLSRAELTTIIKEDLIVVRPGYKARTGVFDIGRKKNWLYSKKLFPEPAFLHGALTELVRTAIEQL